MSIEQSTAGRTEVGPVQTITLGPLQTIVPTYQGEISKRAYFIHLEEGESDELGNWLRAERELTRA